MKKIALVLILVLTVTFCFAGCDMVKLNTERDDALIVADVNYENLTDTVTKKELKTFFAQQGYFLIAYAGMSEEEAYKYCVDALSQQKLTKLVAIKYLCDKNGLNTNIAVSDSRTINDLVVEVPTLFNSVLDVVERVDIIKDYNKQMEELINNYIKEIEQEEALKEEDKEEKPNTPEEEEKVKDKPTIRETRPEEEKSTEFIAYNDLPTDIDRENKDNELKTLYRFERKWAEEEHTEKQIEAKKRLDAQLKKIGKTYDELFNDLVNNAVVEHYKREIVKADRNETINNIFADKKAQIKKNNQESFVVTNPDGTKYFMEDKYKSAIAGAETVYYHPIVKDSKTEIGTTGYGYTFNILLKFKPVHEGELKDWMALYNADGVLSEDEKADLEAKKLEYAEQITVNISNPKYNPSKVCIDTANKDKKNEYKYHDCDNVECPLRPFGFNGLSVADGKAYPETVVPLDELETVKKGYNVSVFTVLNMINYDLEKVNAKYDANPYSLDNEFNRQVELREVFTKWMYMVNDDPGMFSKDNARGYMVPKTGKSDFVDSYTNQSRELMGATVTDNKPNYDSADIVYNKDNQKNYVGNYTTSAISDTRANEVGKKLEGYKPMIAVSEFGIHIIMISEMPGFYQENGYLMDDAVASFGRTKYTKVKDAINNSVKETIERKVYADSVKPIQDKYDDYVTVHENVYKSLIQQSDKK